MTHQDAAQQNIDIYFSKQYIESGISGNVSNSMDNFADFMQISK